MARRSRKGRQHIPTQEKVREDSEKILEQFLSKTRSPGIKPTETPPYDSIDGGPHAGGNFNSRPVDDGYGFTDYSTLPGQRRLASPRRRSLQARTSIERHVQVNSNSGHTSVTCEENVTQIHIHKEVHEHSKHDIDEMKKGKLSKVMRAGKRALSHLRPGKARSYSLRKQDSRSSSVETVSKPDSKRSRVHDETDDLDESDAVYMEESLEVDGMQDVEYAFQSDTIATSKEKSKPGLLTSIHKRFTFRKTGRKRSKETKRKWSFFFLVKYCY